jgi:hypothetical protein
MIKRLKRIWNSLTLRMPLFILSFCWCHRNSPIPSASPTASVPASPVEHLDMKGLAISRTKPPPPMKMITTKTEPDVLVRVAAELHLFDAVEGVFMLQDDNVVASVIETGTWECIPSSCISRLTYLRLAFCNYIQKDLGLPKDGGRDESCIQLRMPVHCVLRTDM